MQVIDIVKVTYNKVVVYKEYQGIRNNGKDNENSIKNLEKKHTATKLTTKHKKKMETILENWLTAIEIANTVNDSKRGYYQKKLTFITLTLPATQMHTDKEIKRHALNRMILNFKRKFGVTHYFWIIETQKNGNLHFHIIVDRYVSYNTLKILWNNIMRDMGYIDQYRKNQLEWHKEGFRVKSNLLKNWDIDKQKKAYAYNKQTNFNHPNSVDVKKIGESKNLFAYLLKYVSKGSDGRELDGRLFGYSDGLKLIKSFDDTIDTSMCMFLNELVDDENIRKYRTDYATIFEGLKLSEKIWDNKDLAKKLIHHYISCYYQLYEK